MNSFLGFAGLVSEAVIERLGWVLVHSLWQFALVALLAGALVRSLRRNSAATRYVVLIVAMAASVVAPMVTWLIQPEFDKASGVALARRWEQASNSPPSNSKESADALTGQLRQTKSADASALQPAPAESIDILTHRRADATPLAGENVLESHSHVVSPADQTEPSWLERAKSILRPWLAWIVAAWSLGVVICSLRPMLGWHTLRRLRRVGVLPPSAEILAAMRRISAQLGLSRTVRVWQSTLAQVPVVVGYLHPVILLPVSLLTAIPAVQLEAILAHELAHVRRHDFIVNLLQTLIETLFFYHPAIWWLSHQVRIEREHCCDDLVVALLGNRVEYGRALVAIEQLRGRQALLALGATDGPLLARVRRIAGLNAESASRWPLSLLSLATLGLAVALSTGWGLVANQGRASTALQETAPEVARADLEKKLPLPKSDDVRGLDLSKVPVRSYEAAYRSTPDLYTQNPENPDEWIHPRNVFPLPLAENTWLYYPGGSGHFYIEHRHDGTPESEQIYGPIDGDPFEVLKLEDLLRERLKPGSKSENARYRLRLMFRTGEPGLVRRAWRMIEPELAPKFSSNEERFYDRFELFEGVRDALRDRAEAFRNPELQDVVTKARQRVEAAETEFDELNDSVSDESYQSATYLQPKIAAKIPDELWGQPLDGVRLALVPREWVPGMDWNELPVDTPVPASAAVQPGGEFQYQLVVENVSDGEIKLCGYVIGEEMARRLEVLDNNGKPVEIRSLHTTIPHFRSYWRLKPGERYLLSMPAVHFISTGPDESQHRLGYSVKAVPGEYTLRCSMVFGHYDNARHRHVPGKTEWIGTLSTGTEKITVADEIAANGDRSDNKLEAAATVPETSPPDTGSETAPEKAAVRLRGRADLILKGLKSGNVKLERAVRACQDLAEVDLTAAIQRFASLLTLSEKLFSAGQITRADFLSVKSAYALVNARAMQATGSDTKKDGGVKRPDRPALVLPDHVNVMAVGFVPGGKRLVSVATEKPVFVRCWDTNDRTLIHEAQLETDKHGNRFAMGGYIKLSADCKRVIAIIDGQIGIWDAETGKIVKMLTQPDESQPGLARNLACTPDMTLIACGQSSRGGFGTRDADATVWDVAAGSVLRTVKHVGAMQIQSVALSADGQWLATGSQEAGTCVWDVSSGKRLLALTNDNPGRRHPDPEISASGANQVLCLSFSPDGRQLAIGDMLGVKLVDAKSGELQHDLERPFRLGRSGLVFSPNGRLLARFGTDKVVAIWSTQTGKLLAELPTEAHGGAFSDDGRFFAVGFTDEKNGVAIWPLRDAAAPAALEKEGAQAAPAPLEFRIAANPADSKLEPRVPADFEKRHYPDNSEAGRAAAKDTGFIWIRSIISCPVEAVRGDGLIMALLADTREHAMLGDGTWSVEECRVVPDPQVREIFGVELKLDEAGGRAMHALTKSHLDQRLAIVVNGEIIAAPIIRSEIGRAIAIVGNYTRKQAEELAAAISGEKSKQRDASVPEKPASNEQEEPRQAPDVSDPPGQANGNTPEAVPVSEAVRSFLPSIVTVTRINPKTGLPDPNPNWWSGIVVDGRGYILTTWPGDKTEHSLRVRLADQREYSAEVIVIDANRSLAVLRIETTQELAAVSLSKISVPQKGDVVFAVPSPAQKSATRGVVTDIGQSLGKKFPMNLIRTNVPIPVGEPGSLMVTEKGEPVGIWVAVRKSAMPPETHAVPLKDALPIVTKALQLTATEK